MSDWKAAERDWPGLIVLVGLTRLAKDGSVDGYDQFYGQIVSVDPTDGIEIDLSGAARGRKILATSGPRSL